MASRYKVTGKTVESLLNRTVRQMLTYKESTVRQITTRLVSAANKRLARLEKAGIVSPASREVMETGGKFSIKGKSKNEVLLEFARIKKFMAAATSTVSGYKKEIKKVTSELRKKPLTEKEVFELFERGNKNQIDAVKNAYSMYDTLKEFNPSLANQSTKYTVVEMIREYDYQDLDKGDQGTLQKAADFLADKLSEMYETGQRESEKFSGVSSFLGFGNE